MIITFTNIAISIPVRFFLTSSLLIDLTYSVLKRWKTIFNKTTLSIFYQDVPLVVIIILQDDSKLKSEFVLGCDSRIISNL